MHIAGYVGDDEFAREGCQICTGLFREASAGRLPAYISAKNNTARRTSEREASWCPHRVGSLCAPWEFLGWPIADGNKFGGIYGHPRTRILRFYLLSISY